MNPTNPMNPVEHPSHSRQKARYALWRDLYRGGDCVEGRPEYLPRHPFETDRQYGIRLARSAYRNFAAPVVSVFHAAIWRKAPLRRFGAAGPSPEVELILADADRRGAPADRFFGEATRRAAAAGIHFVLVDMPRLEEGRVPATLEEVRELGLRPYFVHVGAEQLVDWGFDLDTGELSYAVVAEEVEDSAGPFCGHGKVRRYRVYTREGWSVWREGAGGVEPTGLAGEHGLGRVPLVAFAFEEEEPMVGRAAHADIDSLVLRVYRRDSELDKALFDACVPIAVFSGFREEEVREFVRASSSGLLTENVEAHVTYVEPAGTSLARIREAILDDERSIREIALRLVRPDSKAAESAEAKRLDRSQLNARVSAFAQGCSRAETACWRLAAAWLGQAVEVSVAYNQDYEAEEAGAELARILSELSSGGLISRRTALEGLKRLELLPGDFDPEAELARLGAGAK